jgi:hypothetical protein
VERFDRIDDPRVQLASTILQEGQNVRGSLR